MRIDPHLSFNFEHEHVVAKRPGDGEGCTLAEATCDQDTPFTEAEVACLLQQIISGLHFLHSKDVCHGNLNLSNLIIDASSGSLKVLADKIGMLGKGGTSTGKNTEQADGCINFASPEQISGAKLRKSMDIWSLGGITLDLLLRGSPQEQEQRDSPRPALLDVARGRQPMYPLGLSLDCISFLEDCFELDAAERASTGELLEHPFIRTGCAAHDADADTDADAILCSAIDSMLVISEALRSTRPPCRPAAVAVLPSKGKACFSMPSHTERECRYGHCGLCGAREQSASVGQGLPLARLAPMVVAAQKTVKGALVVAVDGDGSRSPASAAATKRAAPAASEEGRGAKMEKPSKRLCTQWYNEELEQRMNLSLLGYAT